ncbi:hypothetical protein D3C76_1860770 [compost metagenome]
MRRRLYRAEVHCYSVDASFSVSLILLLIKLKEEFNEALEKKSFYRAEGWKLKGI